MISHLPDKSELIVEKETDYIKKKKRQRQLDRKKRDLRRLASVEDDGLKNEKMTQPMMPFANHDAIDMHKKVQKNASIAGHLGMINRINLRAKRIMNLILSRPNI